MAFRFSVIDRIPEPPSALALKGTLVHRALERLFWSAPPGRRDLDSAQDQLALAWKEAEAHPDLMALEMSPDQAADFLADAQFLVRRYFELEDPNAVQAIGVELSMEARVGSLCLRGIIDRLDLDYDGQLVVTDYKTGKIPGLTHEQARLGGVHFYALLCQEVLGLRPARVQLLYLRDATAIVATPSDQSIKGLERRSTAIWSAMSAPATKTTSVPRCRPCAISATSRPTARPSVETPPRASEELRGEAVSPPNEIPGQLEEAVADSSFMVNSALISTPAADSASRPPASRSITHSTASMSAPRSSRAAQEETTWPPDVMTSSTTASRLPLTSPPSAS